MFQDSLVLLTCIFIVSLLIGLLLGASGLRGRRVDDHPICRKCRFDLFSVYPKRDMCPECGAALSSLKAIRHGNRRRRVGLMGVGVALAGVSACMLAAGTWAWSHDFDWNTVKPVWWLLWDTEGGTTTDVDAALNELVNRLKNDGLSAKAKQAVIEQALAYQADLNRPWNVKWGTILESAHALGVVDSATWRRYIEGGVLVSLLPRRQVRADGVIPFHLVISTRLAENHRYIGHYRILTAQLGHWSHTQPEELLNGGGSHTGAEIDDAMFLERYPVNQFTTETIEPGVYSLSVMLDITLRHSPGRSIPVHRWQTELTTPVNIVSADQSTVNFVHAPTLRPVIKKAITTRGLIVSKTVHPGANTVEINLPVYIRNLPIGVSYGVYVRESDREPWLLGCTSSLAGRQITHHLSRHVETQRVPQSETVDIILRPEPEAAELNTRVYEAWDGILVIKDVPVLKKDKVEWHTHFF